MTEKQKKKAEKRRLKAEKKRLKAEKRGKKYEEDEDMPPKLWVQPFEGGAYLLPVRAEVTTGMGKVVMYLSALNVTDTEAVESVASEAIESPTKTASSR